MNAREKTRRAKERAAMPHRHDIIFAARCSQLRHRLQLSQVEFSNLLGRHWLTVSRWERIAGHSPSRESMRRFQEMEGQQLTKIGGDQ